MTQRLLFQRLPVSLFALLAAPSAELYADILLRIFTTTQQHQELLSWERCVSLIVEAIEDRESNDQLAQLDASSSAKEEKSTAQDIRAKATDYCVI